MPAPEPRKGGDSALRSLVAAVAVCCASSLVVTTTAVLLRPRIEANRAAERQARLLELVERQPGLAGLLGAAGGAAVEARVVELATGAYADWLDPATFDARAAAEDPTQSTPLAPDRDPAGLGRIARYATVVLVRRGDALELVLLPVCGQGYASMLYGYLAVSPDGETVRGLSFYEHDETPGLGAEIEDPAWRELWAGKRIHDADGLVRLGVATDEVAADAPDAAYLVDGLTGATRTCDGVTALLRFWLGEDGFGPFLRRVGS